MVQLFRILDNYKILKSNGSLYMQYMLTAIVMSFAID